MTKSIPEQKLKDIEAVVSTHPKGIAIQDIHRELDEDISRRTLQYRLKHLVDVGRLVKAGEKRGTRYLPPSTEREGKIPEAPDEEMAGTIPITKRAVEIQKNVRKPVRSRIPVGYKRAFLTNTGPTTLHTFPGKSVRTCERSVPHCQGSSLPGHMRNRY